MTGNPVIWTQVRDMAYDFSNLKFLIADDNKYMRSVFREFLRALGLRPENMLDCADGSEALDLLRSFDADVAIVDFLMAPMDGIEFTRRVRTDENSPNQYLPIILCSGYTEHARVVEARDAGVNEVLAKPVNATALYDRIASIIENPRPFTKQSDFFGPDRRRRFEEPLNPKREDDPEELAEIEASPMNDSESTPAPDA